MKKFQRILVAVDGSETSERAFKEAVSLADGDTTLHVLYVIESTGNYFGEIALNTPQMYDEVIEKQERKMEDRQAKALAQGVGEVVTHVEYGSPKEIITSYSKGAEPVDLIVIGRTGLNALEKLLVGSTTNYVINHANCNVYVVNI
ncbi:universal stress protein [Enterococcus canis]|nr:universal stress protein [Enterococcus canis]